MFIDTHCHLTGEYVKPIDIAAVVGRARDAGVGALICATAEPGDHAAALKICDEFPNIFCTIGIHPEGADKNIIPKYDSLLSHPKVVGVGEIGLDYHYGADYKKQQIDLFRAQLDTAKRAALPVAIHTREADDDTAAILGTTEFSDITGVMHCYTSGWALARKMLDRGFFISASGILTFKNSDNVRDVFRRVPLDRVVIETDSPFCAPVPYRGKPAEPYMVPMVANMLADMHGVDIADMERILFENTLRLYPKMTI